MVRCVRRSFIGFSSLETKTTLKRSSSSGKLFASMMTRLTPARRRTSSVSFFTKRHNWYAHEAAAWCMVYSGEGSKAAALVEFNDEMCDQLRATSRAIRDCEVKP